MITIVLALFTRIVGITDDRMFLFTLLVDIVLEIVGIVLMIKEIL